MCVAASSLRTVIGVAGGDRRLAGKAKPAITIVASPAARPCRRRRRRSSPAVGRGRWWSSPPSAAVVSVAASSSSSSPQAAPASASCRRDKDQPRPHRILPTSGPLEAAAGPTVRSRAMGAASTTSIRRAVNGIELDVLEAGDPDGAGDRAAARLPGVRLLVAPPDRPAGRRRLPRPRPRPARLRRIERARRRRGVPRRPPRRRRRRPARRHRPRRRRRRRPRLGRARCSWDLARLHPTGCGRRSRRACPYTPWPMPPTEVFKAASGDNFFYILYFQEVGPAERELGGRRARVDAVVPVERVRRGLPGGAAGADPRRGQRRARRHAQRRAGPRRAAGLADRGRPRRLRRPVRAQRVLRTGQLVPQPRRRPPAGQGPALPEHPHRLHRRHA